MENYPPLTPPSSSLPKGYPFSPSPVSFVVVAGEVDGWEVRRETRRGKKGEEGRCI